MVINRDKHNKFFTIVDNTKPQGPTDNQGLSSGDNGDTGSSSGSTGGNTTIIYQGGGMTEDQSNKLNGIEEGAEKNQDAFSYITIQGATSEEDVTLSADDPTDTFKLAAKDSVTLTLEDDVITIGCDGVKYLKELLDVDAENPLDEDLLIYNSETEKWEAINPLFATIEWVNELFDKIIGSAPEVLDTIYEIAEALGNDPDYVKDIANNLSALTNRVTVTELDITDIKSKLLPTNFTDLTSGLLLQYDGQYWVNVDKDTVGLNEDLLLEYLTTNNYAKKSDITWSNLIGKPSIYATNIANITDLNSGWDSLLANAPTKYITRWPNFSEIGSKPTTLVGYGITDGVNSITTSGTGNVITGATISGHVLTLNKGITAITSVSLATINDLHANWDAILKVAPTAYVTRWPSWTEVTDKPDWIESDKPSYSWSEITGKPSVFTTNIANITDLHSTWDAVLKATKPNWLTTVSLATITDLQANWDAILKVAPTSQVTRWPTWAEVTSKPSTLSGYGITDGVNAVSVTGSGNVVSSASISGHTLTLNKGITALTSVSIATISDLHSSWDAVLKALKPAWLTSVSLATISDLHASWDALLKAAPSAYVTRWPTAAEVGALTQTTADGRYLLKSSYTAADVLAKLKTVDGSGSGIDADLLDGLHGSSFAPYTHFGTTAMHSNGYYKISMVGKTNWMYYFKIRLYQNYDYYDIDVAGYSYNENHWYKPRARLISSNANSISIVFGYNGTNDMWVAVPATNYTAIGIYDLVNGYSQVSRYNAFTIAYQETLTGTIQQTVSLKRGASLDDNVASATKLQTARTINGTSFNGTANITTSKWGTARTLTLTGAVTGSVSIDGSGNVSLATTYSTGSAGPLDGRYALIGGSNASGTWPIAISVKDIRGTSPTPNDKTDKAVDFWFNNQDKPGGSHWYSGLTIKGWTDDYVVWQLVSDAGESPIKDSNLYFRSGVGASWNAWKKVLDSTNYTSTLNNRYVTLSTAQTISGVKTFSASTYHRGSLNFDYDTDSSRVYSIYFRNTSKETMGSIGYYNTGQHFFINPMGSDSPLVDAVGRYSLFVGNNRLTYNTYPILHSNNYTSYTVTKTGGGASGTWGINVTGYAQKTHSGAVNCSISFTKNDNSGYDTFLLIADCSSLYTDSSNHSQYGFVGDVIVSRTSGYVIANTGFVSARIGYSTGSLNIYSTVRNIKPCIVKYNSKYYIAFRLYGSSFNAFLRGLFYNTLSTFIQLNCPSASALPNGLSIVTNTHAYQLDARVDFADQLYTARQINGTNFDGTANITTAKWGTARSIYIRDASQAHTGAAVSVDGSTNEYLLLPSTITATLSGNASTASKWATARTITLTGAVTGSVSIDGSGNVSMATTYATGNISALDSRYVNISGDTMTGTLTVSTTGSGSYNQGIRINRTALNQWATLTIGCVGTAAAGTSANTWLIGTPSSSNSLIFNLNNANEWVGLCLKGHGNTDMKWNNNTVWHAGNDGSGSGLDADLLDGTHKTGLLTSVTSSSTTNLSVAVGGTTKSVADLYATYLDGVTLAGLRGLGYAMQSTTIDASSLDEDTWYPVTINLGSRDSVLIALIVSLDSGTKPSWSTHTGGFSVRKVWYSNGNGWGVNAINRVVLFSDYSFTDTDPVRGIGQMSYSSNEYVYVRGGGKYYFFTSHGKVTITLRSSTYTASGQSVSPTTTAPAAIVRNNAYTTDNVASATKLQTACTLWGQSFNGTANVSGNMTGVGSIVMSNTLVNNGGAIELYGKTPFIDFHYNSSTADYTSRLIAISSNTLQCISNFVVDDNVGIGTTSPSYKLHVAGTGYFSGALTTASSFTANSYIYSSTGWFLNNQSGCGLYNQPSNARWYANSSGWISDKKINATAGLAVTGGASVSGDLTIGSTSLILRQGYATSWYNGRDGALIRTTTYPGYNAIVSAKTTNGSWLLGTYTGDLFYFTYVTDANYNAGTNNATYNITLPKKSGTIALTSDIPSITDAVTGNAGSATLGVYVSGNEVKAMTYSLHAHVNSGLTSRLAIYNTNTAISYMNTTVGSSSQPIFISAGVPTACTNAHFVTQYGKYFINSRKATYSTIRQTHAFITSIVRQSEGLLLLSISVPSSVTALNHIFIWGAGLYTHLEPDANGGCYISIYYMNSYLIRVTVHDDASANDGYFYLNFLAIG